MFTNWKSKINATQTGIIKIRNYLVTNPIFINKDYYLQYYLKHIINMIF